MKVVVAGSSGFLGSHLVRRLRERGHEVTRLVRRASEGPDESTWDPDGGALDRTLVGGADVVVNLAGSPTAGNPHSKKWARELRESRIRTTSLLAGVIADAERKPAYLAGNGISYYGDHGSAVLTESADSRGDALLTSVTREWQAAADPAADAGARVCVLRTAPVMDRRAAPLKLLLPLFKAGLGARLGDGSQYMPMISCRDWVAATVHAAEHDTLSGPLNLVCPDVPTNAEFTQALASAVRRRAFFAAPSFVIDKAAGAMGDELLGSVRARPLALEESGFTFRDADVRDVIATGLR
ncbi:TIGR01777 family oxidoreductase [uncultured Nocardioides sp.]|uniref:TIGR01777 family oxidoreductase n=1 Tax=uncultured Nocardioides sp. TaxID=198441 RepID=UPI002606AA47|nr:TIGR01777 family oxidoreductase [uncultured Nocardioides sp.]